MNAARLCGVSEKTGSITKGLAADLVAVSGNPLEDISALDQVTAVYQDGKAIALE